MGKSTIRLFTWARRLSPARLRYITDTSETHRFDDPFLPAATIVPRTLQLTNILWKHVSEGEEAKLALRELHL